MSKNKKQSSFEVIHIPNIVKYFFVWLAPPLFWYWTVAYGNSFLGYIILSLFTTFMLTVVWKWRDIYVEMRETEKPLNVILAERKSKRIKKENYVKENENLHLSDDDLETLKFLEEEFKKK